MPGVRVSPPAGMRSKVVDYVGDGSNDRVVEVGFKPRFYAIGKRIDGNRDYCDVLALDSDLWTFFIDGGYPLKCNVSCVTSSGVNVGLVRFWQGGGNDPLVNYRLWAYA